jgi:hypothetical protein
MQTLARAIQATGRYGTVTALQACDPRVRRLFIPPEEFPGWLDAISVS